MNDLKWKGAGFKSHFVDWLLECTDMAQGIYTRKERYFDNRSRFVIERHNIYILVLKWKNFVILYVKHSRASTLVTNWMEDFETNIEPIQVYRQSFIHLGTIRI